MSQSPSHPLNSLPERLARQIRTASLSLPVRAVVADLPSPLVVSASIGSTVDRLPTAASQLLKLAVVSSGITVDQIVVTEGEDFALNVVRNGEHSAVSVPLTHEALESDIETLIFSLLPELFAVSDLGDLLQSFAFRSAVLRTLHTITSHMLDSTDVEQAIYVMLSGITSGYALGFNRAALFMAADLDVSFGGPGGEEPDLFVGQKAIGPADAEEAFRIWESIEAEDKTVDDLIADYHHRNFDTRFQQQVQGLTLTVDPSGTDELNVCLHTDGAHRFERPVENSSLSELSPHQEFALACVKAHGKPLAIVYADNAYNEVPIDDEQLSAFGFFIDQTALIWENLALLERVGEQATRDPLTGLFNRRAFAEQVAELDGDQPWGLLILDLDAFKRVNDEQGHDAGDEALRTIAGVMRATLPETAIIARHGGDEFVAALPGVKRSELREVVMPLGRAAEKAHVSVSIGASAAPAHGRTHAVLFERADHHLYAAKRAGRGRGAWGGEIVKFRTG